MFHLIIYTPLSHADVIRKALADSSAGKIGNYDSCSFSVQGKGRFRPLASANPAIGKTGTLETVDEERIECVVNDEKALREILHLVKAVHPYEEPAIHVLPMRDYRDFL